MKINLFFIVLLASLFCNTVSAEVFKWTDESGRVHYSDKVKENQPLQSIKAEVNIYKDVPIDYEFSNDVGRSGKKVIMYSTSWCGYCAKARKHFKENGIAFKEYDIEKSQKAKRKYDALGGQGVPLILVGKKSMRGFSVANFNKIYKR